MAGRPTARTCGILRGSSRRSPPGWRINTAESARVRREQYVGPWLPEPVDTSADPSLGAENGRGARSRGADAPGEGQRRSNAPLTCCVRRSAIHTTRSPRSSSHHARERPAAVQPREEACAVRAAESPSTPPKHRSAARSLCRRRPERRREAAGGGALRGASSAPPTVRVSHRGQRAVRSSGGTTSRASSPDGRTGGPTPPSPGSRPMVRPSVLVTRGDAAWRLLSISTSDVRHRPAAVGDGS